MLALALIFALTSPAEALTMQQSGPYVDAGAGLGLGNGPLDAGVGWGAGVGWWAGRYDDAYAVGRYWGAGAMVRQDWIGGTLRTAPMLEVRRGLDLVVLGWHGFLAGGPLVVSRSGDSVVGGTGRVGIGAEFRRTRYLGLTLRLEGGADFGGGNVAAAGAALLGVQFSRPSGKTR